jgi:hypothetical protein
MASPWTIALAIGISFTRPSALTIDQPALKNHATFHNVRWAGQAFVSPLYYVVRIGKGDIALNFTHFKMIAEVDESIPVTGEWHGGPVDETAPMGDRVQHLEISHGVNSFGLIGLFKDPYHRGLYFGGGPVIFMPHAESTVDGNVAQWGYANGGGGFEALAGWGMPAPFADVNYLAGSVHVGVANGTASTNVSTFRFSFAP